MIHNSSITDPKPKDSSQLYLWVEVGDEVNNTLSLSSSLPPLFTLLPSSSLCCLHAAKIRLHALSSSLPSFHHLRRLFRSHEESILPLAPRVASPLMLSSHGSFFPYIILLSRFQRLQYHRIFAKFSWTREIHSYWCHINGENMRHT